MQFVELSVKLPRYAVENCSKSCTSMTVTRTFQNCHIWPNSPSERVVRYDQSTVCIVFHFTHSHPWCQFRPWEASLQLDFRWRRWGSSFPGLCTLDPPLSPPSTPAEIFRHTCLGGGGGWWVVKKIIFTPIFCFCFCDLDIKTPGNISEPYDNPFWEKSNTGGEKREREKGCY